MTDLATPTLLPLSQRPFVTLEEIVDALPARSREKLLALQQARDDGWAVARALSDERNALLREKIEFEAHLRTMLMPRAAGGGGVGEDYVEVRRIRTKLNSAVARLQRLGDLLDQRAEQQGPIANLADALEKWLTSHVQDEFRQHALIEPSIRKGERIVAALNRLRRRVRELQADRRRVESAPPPPAEVKEIARRQVEELARRGAPNLLPLVDNKSPIEFAVEVTNVLVGDGKGAASGITSIQTNNTTGLIAWLHKDALLARIDQEIDELIDAENAMSDTARAAALAEISSDMLACEREEEALVVRAEQEGIAVVRRADADARAVLELI